MQATEQEVEEVRTLIKSKLDEVCNDPIIFPELCRKRTTSAGEDYIANRIIQMMTPVEYGGEGFNDIGSCLPHIESELNLD